jgi:hypothetical protein
MTMNRSTCFKNLLASVALAAALMPIAANATTMTPLDYVRIAAHKAMSGPLPELQNNVVDANAATVHKVRDQVIVQSGATNQLYPESVGG